MDLEFIAKWKDVDGDGDKDLVLGAKGSTPFGPFNVELLRVEASPSALLDALPWSEDPKIKWVIAALKKAGL